VVPQEPSALGAEAQVGTPACTKSAYYQGDGHLGTLCGGLLWVEDCSPEQDCSCMHEVALSPWHSFTPM